MHLKKRMEIRTIANYQKITLKSFEIPYDFHYETRDKELQMANQ